VIVVKKLMKLKFGSSVRNLHLSNLATEFKTGDVCCRFVSYVDFREQLLSHADVNL